MKNRHITTAALAAILLPIGVAAQSTQSPSADRQGASNQPRTSQSQAGQHSQYGQPGTSQPGQQSQYGQRSQTGSQYGQTTQSSMSGQIARVSEDDFKKKVTADKLIGKKVKDRDGKEVGEIKDIGLDGSFASTSRTSSQDRSSSSSSGVSASGSVGTTGTSRTTGAGLSDLSRSGQTGQDEVNVFIKVKDEDAMVSVRASELRYNKEKEEVTIQRSSDEIARVAKKSSSGAAE